MDCPEVELCDNAVQEEYFASYDDISVHELMLKDTARTLAYKEFIFKNKDLIENKIVIDVGAGTGILSLFAAEAGAKKVYAIEASDFSMITKYLIEDNNVQNIIEIVNGAVETLELDIQADVIISEWMGFYLLHESMLSSVIIARDKWLKPDGLLLPSIAKIYACPIVMQTYFDENIDIFNDLYGFDFSPLISDAKKDILITHVDPQQLIGKEELIVNLDLMHIKLEEFQNIKVNIHFRYKNLCKMHGLCLWFDVQFCDTSLHCLSTSPRASKTHWKQTVIPFPSIIEKEELKIHLSLIQDSLNSRTYKISLDMNLDS